MKFGSREFDHNFAPAIICKATMIHNKTNNDSSNKRSLSDQKKMHSKATLSFMDHYRLPLLLLLAVSSVDLASAFHTSTAGTAFVHTSPLKSRLQYRDGDDDMDGLATTTPTTDKKSFWWKPFAVVASSPLRGHAYSAEARPSSDVDDYLEFLERRYHRLHDEEDKPEVKFSALKWLRQEEMTLNEEQRDNALYALGVAGLASERLLHKHQPLKSAAAPADTTEIETTVPVVVEQTEQPRIALLASILMARVSPLIRQVVLRRKLLIRYQSIKLRAFAQAFTKALASAPTKTAKALINLSGGKRNVIVTASILATLFFVILRPVAQTIVSEGRA